MEFKFPINIRVVTPCSNSNLNICFILGSRYWCFIGKELGDKKNGDWTPRTA